MTRANINIICGYPKLHTFEKGGDGYPSEVIPEIFNLVLSCAHSQYGETKENKMTLEFWDTPQSWDLSDFINDLGLTLGHVGNFCYAYEIDFKKQTVKAWESAMRWVNAPLDWEARGWNCWKGSNGKFGYSNWVKGKKLVDLKFSDMVRMEHCTGETYKPCIIPEVLGENAK